MPDELNLKAWLKEEIKDEQEQIAAEKLFEAVSKGHLCIDYPQSFTPSSSFPLSFHKGHLYFTRFLDLEKKLLQLYHDLKDSKPLLSLSLPDLSQSGLVKEQEEAIKIAFSRGLTFITGGPGTGKTHTAALLIEEMLKQHPKMTIAIAAPTGKAVGQLKKSLYRRLPEGSFAAFTLHKLLDSFREESDLLPYDTLLIDESSMIDLELMVRAFESLKPGARLIFMGDPWQLPPVEAGSVFADLAQIAPKAHLNKCLRAELKDIVELADLIKYQDADKVIDFLRKPSSAVFWNENEDFDFSVTDMAVLTPLRKGKWGSEALNLKGLKETKSGPYPIMITRSHESLELYNGDMGTISSIKPIPGDKAYFGNREIPALLLPSWEFAWAISIHKSQGSEFDSVRIILPEGSETSGVASLYTAATRAKKRCEIWSSEKTLRAMIQTSSHRLSGIK